MVPGLAANSTIGSREEGSPLTPSCLVGAAGEDPGANMLKPIEVITTPPMIWNTSSEIPNRCSSWGPIAALITRITAVRSTAFTARSRRRRGGAPGGRCNSITPQITGLINARKVMTERLRSSTKVGFRPRQASGTQQLAGKQELERPQQGPSPAPSALTTFQKVWTDAYTFASPMPDTRPKPTRSAPSIVHLHSQLPNMR